MELRTNFRHKVRNILETCEKGREIDWRNTVEVPTEDLDPRPKRRCAGLFGTARSENDLTVAC